MKTRRIVWTQASARQAENILWSVMNSTPGTWGRWDRASVNGLSNGSDCEPTQTPNNYEEEKGDTTQRSRTGGTVTMLISGATAVRGSVPSAVTCPPATRTCARARIYRIVGRSILHCLRFTTCRRSCRLHPRDSLLVPTRARSLVPAVDQQATARVPLLASTRSDVPLLECEDVSHRDQLHDALKQCGVADDCPF
jgi:hypothetical protein